MPPISICFDTKDFKGVTILQGKAHARLEEKFGARDMEKLPRSCVGEVEAAVTALRNSLAQTVMKVNLEGIHTSWVFVRYSHDPADAATIKGGGGGGSEAPRSETPKKTPAKEPPAEQKKKGREEEPSARPSAITATPPTSPRRPASPIRATPVRSADPAPIAMTPSHAAYTPAMSQGAMNAMSGMSTYDVGKWLMKVGLAKYGDNFEYAAVDGRALLQMRVWCASDVKGFMQFAKEELGMAKAGHALQLVWCLQNEMK